ncbi:MobF family relaxase [Methylobacterium sp. Leaf106]|uniref:MobF family relaxase n=1 Tax=Methylobacterium sp. Leaf106 TaxID=1736255 RepID=UPI0006FA869F|nr:MobF family relaxase [Methylobacterium sp. Leaf106]KQP40336.1 hypothetical protein ASF34_10975 [Methylobacterium sp. Leaf106]
MTYLTGRVSTPGLAMGRHLMQVTLPPDLKEVAAYYGWAHDLDAGPDAGRPVPRLRADLDPRLARVLGLDPEAPLDLAAVANLLSGHRADGRPIPGKQLQAGERVTFIDLCFSADKSVSIAWALAPTEAERAVIALAVQNAVQTTMADAVAPQIGRARRGKAGRGGSEAGAIAWLAFDHWTSRPTPGAVGDAQLHIHCPTMNLVLTPDGRVGGLDLQRLQGRVHELGAIFQAHLAQNLRRAGIAVALDPKHGSARITAIPEDVRAAFAKRTVIGTAAAYAQAEKLGLDWNELDEPARVAMLKQGVQGDPRAAKRDDLGDRVSWQAEAAALGYKHSSVLDTEPARPPLTRTQRLDNAYAVTLDLLEPQLDNNAVLPESRVRLAAARALIATGIDVPSDVASVLNLIHTRGVRQEGRRVMLLPGAPDPDLDGSGWQRAARKYTSGLHVEREAELMELVREAAAETHGRLGTDAISAAVARSGRDFVATEHGRSQRAAMNTLGTGGAFTAVIGVAGSGKTTLLQPLVDAYGTAGVRVYGTASGWKQTLALAETGIPKERCLALAKLLAQAERGKLDLGQETVIVIDELGQIGTRDLLRLMQLRASHGRFRVLAVGDPRQCASVAAGPVIELLQQALGVEAIPEIHSTVRQREQLERETTGLFREGRAAEALARKRADGTAQLVPGGPEAVAEALAELWWERHVLHAGDPRYSLSVSAPTNVDALMVAGAIRNRRRTAGQLSGPDWVIQAIDNAGREFKLTLAVGDRVRLYARTAARSASGQTLEIGVNGSVLTVEAVDPTKGLHLRDTDGRSGLVAWATLLSPASDPNNARYRLGCGDVLTIDSIQGVTSEESIVVMPRGSDLVDAFRGYTAASRHRGRSYIVCSEAAERAALERRRPIGASRTVTEDEIWARIAVNLTREPAAVTATMLVAGARAAQTSARQTLALSLAPVEAAENRGLIRASLRRGVGRGREVTQMAAWAERVAEPLARQLADTAALARHLVGAKMISPPREAIEEAEPVGFGRVRMLRRLEVLAHESVGPIGQQLSRAAGLAQSLTGASTGVMSRPGQLAQRFGHRRALQRIDDWARSLGDWLDLHLHATGELLTAIAGKSSKASKLGSPPEPMPVGFVADPAMGEERVRRKPIKKGSVRKGGGPER